MNDNNTNKYHVSVRTWFDKTHGNTYNSIRITGENIEPITLPMDYGHGDLTYLYRAGKALGLDISAMDWEERRSVMSLSVEKVTRKKDLHRICTSTH